MFSNILHNQNNSKSHEGIELDTDLSKKLYTTYVPRDVLENEIYNHTKTFVEIPHNADLNFAIFRRPISRAFPLTKLIFNS